ncbi:MAG TPA: hypothetical protein VFA59_14545 [Vicinamibacterales bacterium]|nr:hypothetical protein [Vicinamibacterales bacterium]
MSLTDIQPIVIGFVQGFLSSSVFILVLFIGFCVVVGFTKTKRTSGNAPVVKNLDEAVNHHAINYLQPSDPRGPIDQLKGATLKSAI